MKRIHLFAVFLLILIGFAFKAIGAEVLQISSSSSFLIGDQNRTYKIKLACFDVNPHDEKNAENWLRSNFPRHSKVNFQPKGSVDGVLNANIFPLGSHIDISQSLEKEGLGKKIC